MKKNTSNKNYTMICSVFVVSLVIIASSISYAFLKLEVEGETTQTIIETGTYDIETSLDTASAFSATNMMLIDESEIEAKSKSMEFTVKSKNANANAGKFDVYLKDIAISNGMIDSNFKWQLLMDGNIIATGDFDNIDTNGVKSTSKTDTENIKYYDSFNLKSAISFNGYNQSTLKLRVYLLNDNTVNQNNLMNGTFECRVGIEAYI